MKKALIMILICFVLSACGGSSQENRQELPVNEENAEISHEESTETTTVKLMAKFQPSNVSRAKALGTVHDINNVTVDIVQNTIYLIHEQQLIEENGTWTCLLTDLPIGPTLEFIAHAYNEDEMEIFTGRLDKILSGNGDSIDISMSPIGDGIAITLPQITQISRPSQIDPASAATVQITIAGNGCEIISFQFLPEIDGGTFDPLTGTLTLTEGSGLISANYAAPVMTGTYYHTIRVENSQGNITEADFEIKVQEAGEETEETSDGALSIQFNPVILGLKGKRQKTDLTWTAMVSDDGPQEALNFLWEFDGGLQFTDDSINPANMEGYTEMYSGTLTLTVSDDNGNTTIHYYLPSGQFPDLLISDLCDEIIKQPDPTGGQDLWITNIYNDGGLDDFKLRVGGWGDYYCSLLQFDLNGLPPHASSATLYLYCYNTTHTGCDGECPTSMYLDMLTSPWDEENRWQNRPSYTNIDTLPAPVAESWYAIDITGLYNDWQNGTYANHGIQLSPIDNNNRMNEFYSSDHDEAALRPKLVINP